MVLRCLGAFIPSTTFIRDLGTLLQIQQVAQLRSDTCSMQGLDPTRRRAQRTPSTDVALEVVHAGDVEVTRAEGGTPFHLQ
jgi:hypothetical protein